MRPAQPRSTRVPRVRPAAGSAIQSLIAAFGSKASAALRRLGRCRDLLQGLDADRLDLRRRACWPWFGPHPRRAHYRNDAFIHADRGARVLRRVHGADGLFYGNEPGAVITSTRSRTLRSFYLRHNLPLSSDACRFRLPVSFSNCSRRTVRRAFSVSRR